MNSRTLTRFAAVLVVLLVAWAGLGLARHMGRGHAGRIRLTAFDPGVADGALVVHRTDTLRFVRRGGGWLVNAHTANDALVTGLLRALADTEAVAELISTDRSTLPQLGLDSASAWRISALLGRRVLGALMLGTRGTTNQSVYVRQPGATTAFLLTAGQLADATDRLPDDWRDKTIARIAPESVWTVVVRRGTGGYTLTRSGRVWSTGRGRADAGAVAALLGQFKDLEAAGFASAAQADSARASEPARAVVLRTRAGRPLLALQMDSTLAGYWTERAGDSTVYRLDGWTVDQLAPADSILRPKKKAAVHPARTRTRLPAHAPSLPTARAAKH